MSGDLESEASRRRRCGFQLGIAARLPSLRHPRRGDELHCRARNRSACQRAANRPDYETATGQPPWAWPERAPGVLGVRSRGTAAAGPRSTKLPLGFHPAPAIRRSSLPTQARWDGRVRVVWIGLLQRRGRETSEGRRTLEVVRPIPTAVPRAWAAERERRLYSDTVPEELTWQPAPGSAGADARRGFRSPTPPVRLEASGQPQARGGTHGQWD